AAEFAADPGLASRLQQANEQYLRTLRDKDIATARTERENQLRHELIIVQRLTEKEPFWRLMGQRPLLPNDEKLITSLIGWFRGSAVSNAAAVDQREGQGAAQ
ncbi:MAG: hypothetical protein QGG84_08330, partial [Rhodospirillales bacterium]|nr:hypothetical protein [Rhodospirillales bacterium]